LCFGNRFSEKPEPGSSPTARLKQVAEKMVFVTLPDGRGSETSVDGDHLLSRYRGGISPGPAAHPTGLKTGSVQDVAHALVRAVFTLV
jgi:hypothetical protein